MTVIKKDVSKMSKEDIQKAMDAFARILLPQKGTHIPTLLMLTREVFTLEETPEKDEKGIVSPV